MMVDAVSHELGYKGLRPHKGRSPLLLSHFLHTFYNPIERFLQVFSILGV